MREKYEFAGWRLSLTRVERAVEDDDRMGLAAGETDESTVLVIEGGSEIVSSALPLLGQLLGTDAQVTISAINTPAPHSEPIVEQDETGNDADGKPRRKRRTKAEIEADKLREAQAAATAQTAATVAPAPLTAPQSPPEVSFRRPDQR